MRSYLPSIIWSIALTAMFFMDASSTTSLCIFKWMGIDACPGCGIGHSIHYTLHFQLQKAVNAHMLGIPATVVIAWLIIQPFTQKHTPNESTISNDAGPSA